MNNLKITGIILAAVFGIAVLVLGGLGVRYLLAEPRGIVGAEEQIESAPSRISRYEEFFNLCATAQTQKAALEAQKERLNSNPEGVHLRRIESNIAGLKAQIARTVNTYNSRATQSYTSGRFRDSNLPYQLSTKGETQCVVTQ